MTTLEKIYWLPIWLIMFSLLFASGAYFFNQSQLTDTADAYLQNAANKGMFKAEDIEKLLEDLDKKGFKKEKIEIQITPAEALEVGIPKNSDQYIGLQIDTDRVALIAKVFDVLIPGEKKITYGYKRVAKSEEYFD